MIKGMAFLGGIFLAALLLAACNGGEETQPTPTPGVILPSPTPTIEPTPMVEKPDPLTLVPPGYVLDQALEVSLDGSEAGQIVVISHTVREVAKTGDPAAEPVPTKEHCPTDPNLEVDPAACVFRAEIFAYDAASGWISTYVTPELPEPTEEREKGDVLGHRGGIQSVPEAASFTIEDGRDVLVLAFHYCTGVGSGCGNLHEVLAMIGSQVKLIGGGWQALVSIQEVNVTTANPAYFGDDPFCCPSGRRVDTIGLDPSTGEPGVITSELVVCAEGTLVLEPSGPDSIAVGGCGEDALVPGTIYDTTDQTVVEPLSLGGLSGLRQGDRVRVSYAIEECPEGSTSCVWDRLVATKITRLDP